jgi:hypothetical protein
MSIYQAHKKRGQAAIEFIILIVILFSVFMVYTVSTRTKMDEIRDEKEYVLLRDAVKMAQNEIFTAVKVEDGYLREFELPETLELINYTINLTDDIIIGNTENHEYAVMVPNVNGTLKKGKNTITKEDGIVSIQ